jgi:tetratricopeptide (TPR) repeat protein
MINKVLWAVIALPALVSLLSCGSDESQSQLLPMEKPIFKLGYPKDDAQHALLAVTDSQVRVLTRLIDVTADDDPEKTDLLQRRADLYAEQANYFRQKDDATKASIWSDAAIAEFNRVIAYPASAKRRDQAMLGLGLVQYAIDRNDEAKQTLTRFMTEYPASELIGLAHFWYGEVTLREGDISTAEASLQKAAQNRAAPSVRGWYVSPQTSDLVAQYLLGWCSMLRKQYREGLERFQAAAAAKPSGELRSEVARSVGLAAARLLSPSEAKRLVLDIDSRNPSPLHDVARSYFLRGNPKACFDLASAITGPDGATSADTSVCQ